MPVGDTHAFKNEIFKEGAHELSDDWKWKKITSTLLGPSLIKFCADLPLTMINVTICHYTCYCFNCVSLVVQSVNQFVVDCGGKKFPGKIAQALHFMFIYVCCWVALVIHTLRSCSSFCAVRLIIINAILLSRKIYIFARWEVSDSLVIVSRHRLCRDDLCVGPAPGFRVWEVTADAVGGLTFHCNTPSTLVYAVRKINAKGRLTQYRSRAIWSLKRNATPTQQ